MQIEFDITKQFDEDIKNLTLDDREKVTEKINYISTSLLNGKTAFLENSFIPYLFKLKNGLESSLFLIKADENKRIVASVDEDPIFEKISLTLFRLVDQQDAEEAYKQIGKEIYTTAGIL
ncbi:MAG: hypothetical protein JWQ09_3895 [Segetibacter sp.]|nr:hypothetical protein [Segetibacter sp.]